MSTKHVGAIGEQIAVQYLQQKGYAILETNYRADRGEIDIIAQDGDTLVFVEVKTAKNQSFGPPETWVGERKQKQVGKVAALYLSKLTQPVPLCRFDVVGIELSGKSHSINHIENAFWMDDLT